MVFSYRIVVFTMEKDSWAYCELEEAETWPEVIELFFMLSSTEHEILPAHKC